MKAVKSVLAGSSIAILNAAGGKTKAVATCIIPNL